MAVFKCKMCGGTIEFSQGDTIGVCDSCGTKQTLPNVKDDAINSLYNRANTLRLKSEFDRAEELYNKIIAYDQTQAEAYWGIILCKFGIEYVEDPNTFKRVPTCHRTSFDAITADEDFKLAVEYGDAEQRELYKSEAKEIDAIQKDILNIAKNEKPFDVFLCYKETDDSGKRTQDSVIANDIYYQLTQEGFKVFYAAITLEDKLGQEYEPYIFAALNSAKVMLVIGSRPEYFTSVWVKNEWSRFLKIMKKDRSRMLIPCYKDMDAYELPDDFAHLQAQDMSKIGFINDVVRGIKKVINNASHPKKLTAVKEAVVMQNENGNVRALIDRGFMALEDGEWEKADGFFEQALNFDAKIAEAYLGKLMAELKVRKQEDLADCEKPFDEYNNYNKAVRFADEKLSKTLQGYISHINDRNENARMEGIYAQAVSAMNAADTQYSFEQAAQAFESIENYKDSSARAKECRDKAEICRKDKAYETAQSCIRTTFDKKVGYENAIKLYETISGWKDADEQIIICQNRIKEIKQKEEADRLAAEREAEEKRIADDKTKKKAKIITVIVASLLCIFIVFIIVLNAVIIPNNKYADAVSLLNNGKYEDAITIFETIDEYKDSHAQIEICKNAILKEKYDGATLLLESGDYEKAYSILESLGEYGDASNKIAESKYSRAMDFYERGEYAAALIIYKQLPSDYKDVKAMIDKSTINQKLATVSKATIGSVVKYGTYTQTAKGEETEIEWYVIDKKDGKALLFSKYILDREPFYKSEPTTPGWEISYIRDWLNSTFYTSAFDTYEQKCIVKSKLTNKNYAYGYGMSNDTYDNVFLLSVEEANDMLISRNILTAESTPYVKKYNDSALYYLRTIGNCDESKYYTRGYVAVVGNEIVESGLSGYPIDFSYNAKFGIRPAIWVDLSQINN